MFFLLGQLFLCSKTPQQGYALDLLLIYIYYLSQPQQKNTSEDFRKPFPGLDPECCWRKNLLKQCQAGPAQSSWRHNVQQMGNSRE